MSHRYERATPNNRGATHYRYLERIYGRSDLVPHITHLTRPSSEALESILKQTAESDNDAMWAAINRGAVDTLVRILYEGVIKGSTTATGFIIGKTPAVCFQEVPMFSLARNMEIERIYFDRRRPRSLRYTGVGISFDRFYAYSKGARPVLYEQKDVAKTLLPETEHWRIVSLELERRDPYVENFFGDDGKPTVLHELETKIIDWTHEREWRTPGDFHFKLLDDFTLNNHVTLVFPDRQTYDYFLAAVERHNHELDDHHGLIDLAFELFEPNTDNYEDNYHIITLDTVGESQSSAGQ